jgi:hypothetical protein
LARESDSLFPGLTQRAAATAQRKRWTFLLTAAPLTITGGTGSPLNPIATF